jgi:hypothetical protein
MGRIVKSMQKGTGSLCTSFGSGAEQHRTRTNTGLAPSNAWWQLAKPNRWPAQCCLPIAIMFELIANWLKAHSSSVERVGNELRFVHSATESSLLIVKDQWVDGLIPVQSELLCGFFDEGVAASIGNGHVVIGSTIMGGVEVSHGYRIPDLNQMRLQAVDLGMTNSEAAETFMMEASWMFLYGVDPRTERLVRFDRDFGTYESLSSIENVLGDWWQIVVNDGRVAQSPPTPDSPPPANPGRG